MMFMLKKKITNLYHSKEIYSSENCTIKNFINYDNRFNKRAGIYEVDKSMKYLQAKLDYSIQCIADNIEVEIAF